MIEAENAKFREKKTFSPYVLKLDFVSFDFFFNFEIFAFLISRNRLKQNFAFFAIERNVAYIRGVFGVIYPPPPLESWVHKRPRLVT